MNKQLKSLAALILSFIFGFCLLSPASAYRDPVCSSLDPSSELYEAAGCGAVDTMDDTVRTVVNTLLYIAGILAGIMIIYSGLKMTLSAGDSGAVTKAKQTLIYAIVGLVIAILAYAIVNFVVGKL